MVHRGEIVEQAVRQSGIAISEVAKRMKKSRRHLYNLFENPNVPIETILQISKIIRKDISAYLPNKSNENHLLENEINEINRKYPAEENAEYWKNKYLLLLEKYNALLEKKQG